MGSRVIHTTLAELTREADVLENAWGVEGAAAASLDDVMRLLASSHKKSPASPTFSHTRLKSKPPLSPQSQSSTPASPSLLASPSPPPRLAAKVPRERDAIEVRDERIRAAFTLHDADGDGECSLVECIAALHDLGALATASATHVADLLVTTHGVPAGGDDACRTTFKLEDVDILETTMQGLAGTATTKLPVFVPADFASWKNPVHSEKLTSAFEAFVRRGADADADHGHGASTSGGTKKNGLSRNGWARLVAECGLVGGAVNAVAVDVIFGKCAQSPGPSSAHARRLSCRDDPTGPCSFLRAVATIAAEHRCVFFFLLVHFHMSVHHSRATVSRFSDD